MEKIAHELGEIHVALTFCALWLFFIMCGLDAINQKINNRRWPF